MKYPLLCYCCCSALQKSGSPSLGPYTVQTHSLSPPSSFSPPRLKKIGLASKDSKGGNTSHCPCVMATLSQKIVWASEKGKDKNYQITCLGVFHASFKSWHGNRFGNTCISYLAMKSVTFTKFKNNFWVQGELNTWGVEKKEWTTCADMHKGFHVSLLNMWESRISGPLVL